MMSRPHSHHDAPSLRELQRQVAAQILGADPRPRAPLDRWLAVPPGAESSDRLAVYVDGYPARLHDALAEQFPAVVRMVGATRFHALVHRFLHAARLPSYNLNDAGAEMSAFLRADAFGEELPFLSDLADLEWLVVAGLPRVRPRAPHDDRSCRDRPRRPARRVRPLSAVSRGADVARGRSTRCGTPARPRLARSISISPSVSTCWCGAIGLAVACAPIDGGRAAALQSLLAGEALADVAERPTIRRRSSRGWVSGLRRG